MTAWIYLNKCFNKNNKHDVAVDSENKNQLQSFLNLGKNEIM